MSVNPVLTPLTPADEAALRSVLRYGDGPDDGADRRLKAAFALLRRIEWSDRRANGRRCPSCGGFDPASRSPVDVTPVGHHPDCELAAFLAEGADS